MMLLQLCAVAVAIQNALRNFRSGVPPVATIAMQGHHRLTDTQEMLQTSIEDPAKRSRMYHAKHLTRS